MLRFRVVDLVPLVHMCDDVSDAFQARAALSQSLYGVEGPSSPEPLAEEDASSSPSGVWDRLLAGWLAACALVRCVILAGSTRGALSLWVARRGPGFIIIIIITINAAAGGKACQKKGESTSVRTRPSTPCQ